MKQIKLMNSGATGAFSNWKQSSDHPGGSLLTCSYSTLHVLHIC